MDRRIARVIGGIMVGLGSALPVLASETPTDTIYTIMDSAVGTVQEDAMTMIQTVLPAALAIGGAVVVVTLGWRIFRRITGR